MQISDTISMDEDHHQCGVDVPYGSGTSLFVETRHTTTMEKDVQHRSVTPFIVRMRTTISVVGGVQYGQGTSLFVQMRNTTTIWRRMCSTDQ